jgi:hypothetical protein
MKGTKTFEQGADPADSGPKATNALPHGGGICTSETMFEYPLSSSLAFTAVVA